MPYISGSGTPAPIGTDAFAPPTQLKALVDGEADFNYFLSVAVDSDRSSLATPQLRDGIHVFVKATNLLWYYNASTWTVLNVYRDQGWETFTAAALSSAQVFGSTHSFASLPFATQVELEYMGIADSNGSPSTRTFTANFVTTGTGVTLYESVTEATSVPSGSNKGPLMQLSTLDIPASTAATAKLQITPSSTARIAAGGWRWRRVSV